MIQDLVQGIVGLFRTYPTEERRRFTRLTCRYAVYCIDKKKSYDTIVSDIGPYGLRLDSVHRFRPGQKLEVIYRGVPGGRLTRVPFRDLKKVKSRMPCKVQWVKKLTDNYQVGLVFEKTDEQLAETWVKPILDNLGFAKGAFEEKRSLVRARALLDSEVRCETNVQGLMVNVSLGGALFQSKQHLNPGTEVTLHVNSHKKLPRLTVKGVILYHGFDVISNSSMHCIQFKDVDQATLDTLSAYVKLLLKTAGSG